MKWVMISLGYLAVFGGAVTFWLPIPVGLPLMMLGIPLLVRYSSHARHWILQVAQVSPALHHQLTKIPPAGKADENRQ